MAPRAEWRLSGRVHHPPVGYAGQGKSTTIVSNRDSCVRMDPGWIVGGDGDARAAQVDRGCPREEARGVGPAGRGKGGAGQGGRAAGQQGPEVARRVGGNEATATVNRDQRRQGGLHERDGATRRRARVEGAWSRSGARRPSHNQDRHSPANGPGNPDEAVGDSASSGLTRDRGTDVPASGKPETLLLKCSFRECERHQQGVEQVGGTAEPLDSSSLCSRTCLT